MTYCLQTCNCPNWGNFKSIWSFALNFKAVFLCLLQLIYNRGSRKIPASISAIAFTLFDRFLFFFSWVIQQPCFHDVKYCLLDARGASFLTSRKKIIWLQSRSNFLDFRALLFLIWFKSKYIECAFFLSIFAKSAEQSTL